MLTYTIITEEKTSRPRQGNPVLLIPKQGGTLQHCTVRFLVDGIETLWWDFGGDTDPLEVQEGDQWMYLPIPEECLKVQKALEFYADKKNYRQSATVPFSHAPIELDSGDLAIEALALMKPKQNPKEGV
jgi:hypothetical protein